MKPSLSAQECRWAYLCRWAELNLPVLTTSQQQQLLFQQRPSSVMSDEGRQRLTSGTSKSQSTRLGPGRSPVRKEIPLGCRRASRYAAPLAECVPLRGERSTGCRFVERFFTFEALRALGPDLTWGFRHLARGHRDMAAAAGDPTGNLWLGKGPLEQ